MSFCLRYFDILKCETYFQKSLDRETFRKVKDVIDGPSVFTNYLNGAKSCYKKNKTAAGTLSRQISRAISIKGPEEEENEKLQS